MLLLIVDVLKPGKSLNGKAWLVSKKKPRLLYCVGVEVTHLDGYQLPRLSLIGILDIN